MKPRSTPRAMILLVVAIFMTSACTSDGAGPRQVAVTPIAGSLEAPRMSVPLRPDVCRETAQAFGLNPDQACSNDSPSLFLWLSFSNPTCFADEPIRVTVVRPEQSELPDRIVVADLQTSEGCSDPLDGLAAVVELRGDELLRGGHPAALVGRLAVDGSVAGAPMLLVMDARGGALLPMEVPFTQDHDTEE